MEKREKKPVHTKSRGGSAGTECLRNGLRNILTP